MIRNGKFVSQCGFSLNPKTAKSKQKQQVVDGRIEWSFHSFDDHVVTNIPTIHTHTHMHVPVAGSPTMIITNLSLVVVPMTSSGAAFSPSGNRCGVGLLIILLLLLLLLLALMLEEVDLISGWCWLGGGES